MSELLFLAQVWSGDLDQVIQAIQNGVDLSFVDPESGSTALHVAASQGHDRIAAILLNKSAAVNVKDIIGNTPLHKAAEKAHNQIISMLCKEDASLEEPNNLGFTALHLAVWRGNETTVPLLLSFGANVEARTSWQCTPLHFAVMTEKISLPIIINLLSKNANVNAIDMNEKTVLHYASEKHLDDVIQLVIQHQHHPNL